jgi:cyclomaltodextrinase / maltogenic alpha-amylase / neopullulanase
MAIDTPAWARDAIFYQIFPDRLARSARVPQPGPLEPWDALPTVSGFKGGDLLGVVEHLDRLADLGITALYLNPVFASASNHRYHTDDYFHVDPLLGGDAALRELLDQTHARGMRVILDGVFNHAGRGFWPFHHVVENGAASPYREWFHLDAEVLEGRRGLRPYPSVEETEAIEAMRRSGVQDGTASRRVLGYQAWWDLPALPKLNLEAPALRAMMLEVAEHWIGFGIDGWRLDVPEEVGEDFWREFRSRVRAASRDAYLVGEIWYPKPEWLTGEHFDAVMNYPLLEAVVGFVAGRHLDHAVIGTQATLRDRIAPLDGPAFGTRISELLALYDPAVTAVQLNMLDSHDTPRLRTMCGGDLDAVRLATLVTMTLPGAPCLFYGTEIGMSGGGDPDCRRAFPEDPTAWVAEPHDWIADLIALRRSSRALRDGGWLLVGAEGRAAAWLRTHAEDAFVVVANAGEEPLDWRLEVPGRWGEAAVVPIRGNREPAWASITGAEGGASRLDVRLDARDGTVVRLTASPEG